MSIYVLIKKIQLSTGSGCELGWNGPDTNTNWAGFQYRALAAVGH